MTPVPATPELAHDYLKNMKEALKSARGAQKKAQGGQKAALEAFVQVLTYAISDYEKSLTKWEMGWRGVQSSLSFTATLPELLPHLRNQGFQGLVTSLEALL